MEDLDKKYEGIITPEELKKNMERFVGKRCLLLSKNGSKGKRGITECVQIPVGQKWPVMVVKFDVGGHGCAHSNDEIVFFD
jgi:hypothetical protein